MLNPQRKPGSRPLTPEDVFKTLRPDEPTEEELEEVREYAGEVWDRFAKLNEQLQGE